jgi:hypothetical protein
VNKGETSEQGLRTGDLVHSKSFLPPLGVDCLHRARPTPKVGVSLMEQMGYPERLVAQRRDG